MIPLRALACALLCGSLAACGSSAAPQTSSPAAYAAAFDGLDIRRIGNDTACNREYQDRAISRALAELERAGVARRDIEGITVGVAGCEQGGRAAAAGAGAFRVWVNLNGCDGSILVQPGGGLTDTARCKYGLS